MNELQAWVSTNSKPLLHASKPAQQKRIHAAGAEGAACSE